VSHTRRAFIAGIGALSVTQFAFAQTRTAIPGGGSVTIPSPYRTKTEYPNNARDITNALFAYRNWRATMSGHPECDGMLGVAATAGFGDLRSFYQACRPGLSIHWADATLIPGQPWDGNEKRYQIEEGSGPSGPELTCRLAVHRVGFFGVYDEPAHLYAVQHRAGLNVAIWLYDKHGGVKGARRMADRITASYRA
jgi:hypothetical protein